MVSQETSIAPLRRSRTTWIIIAGACLLALFAWIVIFEVFVGSQRSTTRLTTILDLCIALTGTAGAIGYTIGKRWSVWLFGISALGHCVAHGILIMSAILQHRATMFSIGGLSVIPIVACMLWAAMLRAQATHSLN